MSIPIMFAAGALWTNMAGAVTLADDGKVAEEEEEEEGRVSVHLHSWPLRPKHHPVA